MFDTKRRSGRTLIGAAAGMAVASMSLAGCCSGPCGNFLNCQSPEFQNTVYCGYDGGLDGGDDAGVDGGDDAGTDAGSDGGIGDAG
jgi:hypothetical protein